VILNELENSMRYLQRSTVVSAALAISLVACASSQAPQELLDARSAYLHAQGGIAPQFKPDQLHEAKVALDKAEQSFMDDPGDQKTKDLSYVATRKAQLAETNASNEQAKGLKGQADNDVKTTTAGQLAQTRTQLASAGQALAGTQQALDAEKKARVDADKRAKEAMDRLAASIGTVKQETRGTVITLSGSVLFASNKDALLPAAQDRLGQVAEALKNQGDHKILVEGHTDSQGQADYNQGLSERRAQAVVSFLTSKGVPSEQVRAQGLGQSRPIADNTSAEGRANNRRVEIVIQPVEVR
jgi:outer membrane protein OmpA-like peptidoglycan-associated protein